MEMDSMLFEVTHINYRDTLTVKIKDQIKDSLLISQVNRGPLKIGFPFEIEGNIPFKSIDESKITILDKDSTSIDFSVKLDTLNNRYQFNFIKTEMNSYQIMALPGAITDFFEHQNDTLKYSTKTRALSDYGNVRVILQNATYPVIIQLIDQSDKVVGEMYSLKQESLDFKNINPGKYQLRVIFDTNKNGRYDPGSYLKKYQSERVSYYPGELDVRASWNLIEEFILQQ